MTTGFLHPPAEKRSVKSEKQTAAIGCLDKVSLSPISSSTHHGAHDTMQTPRRSPQGSNLLKGSLASRREQAGRGGAEALGRKFACRAPAGRRARAASGGRGAGGTAPAGAHKEGAFRNTRKGGDSRCQ
ncbi:hypothetical protein LEMLEM_LOCUS8965 [Lemmus lemmus]